VNLLWKMTEYKNALMAPIYLSQVSAWHGHIPFAFFISEVIRPSIMVELGVHNGDSYIAFLQGLQAAGEPGKAYGIDTWIGDEHSGLYPEHVYPQLKALHDPVFGHFSTLLRETFEEANAHFADGTIDLLHIDGCHTYEAVSRDLEMWLPKVSPRGVVLLHGLALLVEVQHLD
jgi:predicted O-methyltransferase YrrM